MTPFDPDGLELTGQGMVVAEGIPRALQGSYEYAVSETGTLIYKVGDAGDVGGSVRLGWYGPEQSVESVEGSELAEFGDVDAIRLSPGDERYIALEVGTEPSLANEEPLQIWIFDRERRTSTPLTFQGPRNVSPRWMPDGRQVAYISDQGDSLPAIYQQPFDRSGSDELLIQPDRPISSFEVGRLRHRRLRSRRGGGARLSPGWAAVAHIPERGVVPHLGC